MYPIKTVNILTIAGSDSSCGAGIQADLKTIHALGGFALTAITAVTAQNTKSVLDIMPVSKNILGAQLKALSDDIPIHAIKIGMLFNEDIIDAVSHFIDLIREIPIVLDPVMVSTSGSRLLEKNAQKKLINELIPKASLVTPNLQEAAVMTGEKSLQSIIHRIKQMINTPTLIKDIEPQSNQATDLLIMKNLDKQFNTPKLISHNTHGTGCTLSSAIATHLAHGLSLIESIAESKNYVSEKLRLSQALSFGHGHGPLLHL